MADSAAEYFDASDDVLCGSSSELSDESGLSDGSTTNSEPEEGHGKYKHGSIYYKFNFSWAKTLVSVEIKHGVPMNGTQKSMQSTMFSVKASATRKYRVSISKTPNSIVPKSTGKRTKLPAVCPDNSHVGLMAILYNNIGK